MANLIVILILAAILGGACRYIYKSKKDGVKCIGCPSGCKCSSSSSGGGCSGCGGAESGACSGHCGEHH